MPDSPAPTRRGFTAAAAIALAAFGAAALQSQLPLPGGPDWLHTTPYGVGVTAAVLFGFRAVLPLLVGSAAFLLLAGVPAGPAACGLAGELASAALAAGWARRGLPFRPAFDHPRDVLRLALGAAAAALARGGVIAVAATALGLPAPVETGLSAAAAAWLAVVILCPGVVLWTRGDRLTRVPVPRLAEAAALAALIAAQTWAWFGAPAEQSAALSVPALAVLVALGNWVALRFHTRGMVTLVWVVAGVVLVAAAVRGSFAPVAPVGDLGAAAWLVPAGLGVVIVLNLMVAATARRDRLREAEREELTRDARRQADRLADLNAQLSAQAGAIADQMAEIERQRDEFESLARELADQRAWLETVLTRLPVGMLLADGAGRVLSRNALFDAALGLPADFPTPTADDLIRATPAETPDGRPIPPAERPLVRALRDDVTTHQFEMRVARPGGDAAELAMSAAPIHGAGDAVIGAVLAVTDLGPVRRAERVAMENEGRLRLLESAVVHARDAVIVLEAVPHPDRGRSVLYVNDAFTAITGYAREEAVGRSLHFLRGPNTDPATLDRLRVALDTASPFKGELLNYRKDGGEVWVDVSLVPVARPGGGCEHFVMIQRDVTDRKRTEEALRQSEARFRGFFESTAAGVSLTDPDGRFVACNPAFAALLGVPAEAVIGRHPREFTHPDDYAEQLALARELEAGTRDTYQVQKRYVRPDGSVVWTELSVTAIRGPGGELVNGLAVAVDVTERRKLEEQLRQAQKMEALGQLAGGVAHDFNNLLTAVLGNLGLVKLAPDDPNRPLLRTVEQAAGRAADLTRKLLGYARRNQLLVAPVAPADMIGEVVDILRRTLDPRIEMATAVRSATPVLADATLVNQALINLCLNARDAMPDGGTLTLAAEDVVLGPADAGAAPDARPGVFVRLSVADTGTGMTPEVLRRLFEPFFTTKGVGRGTGLGLPMVHGIMRQHGGWVTVESAPGKGSRFDLYLPVAGAAADAGHAPPPRLDATDDTPPPAGDRPAAGTILLVDDEAMIRQLARVVLETAGYTVLEAEDGAEAVEVFRREHARLDLVILDLTMPRLSGRDAFRRIQAIDPGAKVLFSSGYSADDLSEADGARGLLSKPYRPPDLLAAVRRAVAGPAEPAVASS